MRVELEYGRTGLSVELPANRDVRLLSYKQAEPLAEPTSAIEQALDEPLGTPPIADLARGRRSACIAICDITRPVPNELILRPLLQRLERAGIERCEITILVATGLHRPNDRDELIEMVGQPIVDGYRIESHEGRRADAHTFLGESARGIPIWIDSRYVQADLKISIGLIEPHLMAP